MQSRYYNPRTGRFLNADGMIAGATGDLMGYNQFAYCFNNPVNMSDSAGNWPKWAKKLVAAAAVVAVVAVVAAVTVATAGSGTLAAAVAVGAAKGAAIGFVTGAAAGAATGYLATGTLDGALNGMADGALSGSITGAVTGGIQGGLNYVPGPSATPTTASSTKLSEPAKPFHTMGTGSPKHNVNPGGSYTKLGSGGDIYSYTQFDSSGRQIMRIDFQGRPHAGVLPHIHVYQYLERGGRLEWVFDLAWNLIGR